MGEFFSIPRAYPGEKFFLLAGGASLTDFDPNVLSGHGRIIAINDWYLRCPFADILYFSDALWWTKHRERVLAKFEGLWMVSMNVGEDGVHRVRHGGLHGLSLDPTALAHGGNSGYQAIGLAFHLGASRIVLLGYDMHGDHCYRQETIPAQRPKSLAFADAQKRNNWVPRFASLVEPLASHGVSVINCNPDSLIRCFPFAKLSDILLPTMSYSHAV
jgi:hypothetical protein